MTLLGLVDYGAGNLGSVLRAVQAVGARPMLVTTPEDVQKADKLIFPGVGSARQAMETLKRLSLDVALKKHAAAGKPLFGICVGMQVLGVYSEEGNTPCLGILPYALTHFQVQAPVPHMGWNNLQWNSLNPAVAGFQKGLKNNEPDVYYVHSYCARVSSQNIPDYVVATSTYDNETFIGAVAQGHIWGTQFHTEKSGEVGLQLLRNFIQS
jgi:imidazole glycerol phosphate synthase glutamine amidotransferase subunit